MKEMLRQPGKLGASGPFYEQHKDNTAGGNKGDQKQQNQEQATTSLAELTRQYLFGQMDFETYRAQERQLTPRFGEPQTTTAEKPLGASK